MLTFAQCPRCNVDLPPESKACACGWRARAEPEPPRDPAQVERERQEALSTANKAAREWCDAQGLTTLEQKRAYIREKLPKIHPHLPRHVRVPGEDDE